MIKLKIIACIVVVLSILAFGYKAGYNTATIKLNKVSQEAVEEAVAAFKVKADQRIRKIENEREEALRLLEALQNKPVEVEIREVIKIIEKDSCKSLSDDYIRLLNTTIGYDRDNSNTSE